MIKEYTVWSSWPATFYFKILEWYQCPRLTIVKNFTLCISPTKETSPAQKNASMEDQSWVMNSGANQHVAIAGSCQSKHFVSKQPHNGDDIKTVKNGASQPEHTGSTIFNTTITRFLLKTICAVHLPLQI